MPTTQSGADIQRENGWVAIHPAILELLAQQALSGREFRCLLFLFRKTYGYQKKQDNISLSQWEKGTGISRTKVNAVLAGLVEKKIIYRRDNGVKRPATWGFNKYFEFWETPSVPLQGYSQEESSVPLEGYSSEPSVPLQGDKSVPLRGDNNRKKETTNPTGETDAPSSSLAEQFESIVKEMNATKNKVPYLIRIYQLCFGATNAPDGGALAGAAKQIGSASLLAKYLLDNVSRPPVGPVLPYIIATHKNQQKRAAQMGGNREVKDVQFKNGASIYD